MRRSTVAVCAAAALPCAAQSITGYHIGNSLTWDSEPAFLSHYAADQGMALQVGYHINCNRSLDMIAANPTQTCINVVPGFGYYQDAITNVDLTYVTAQPFWTPSSTLGSDIVVISDIDARLSMNPNNTNTVLYIYQGWGWDWFMNNGSWDEPIVDDLDTLTDAADEYFVHLYNRVDAQLSRPVHIIPVGRVLNELRLRILAGEIVGVTQLSDFYRDPVHMSYDIGRFAASTTTAAIVFDRPPFGMHNTWIAIRGDGGYSTQTYIDIENTIWDVISADTRTGINTCLADTNRDGMLSPTDFTAWINAFGQGWSLADQNRDGMVTPTDFTAWIANYSAGCN